MSKRRCATGEFVKNACNNGGMTRVVGKKQRTEFVPDPVEAWHRGRILDQMLARAAPAHPRGVFRGTHAEMERRDAMRRAEAAGRLNPA
jgi:hypothetical protein